VTTLIRVLIVDDDVPTRIGIRAILAPEPDVEVVGDATNGDEAMRLVEQLRPDVVLMDVRLPGTDGIETTLAITRQGATDGVRPRVIILTTFDSPEFAYRALRAGASGFMLKRAPAEEIVDAVRVAAAGDSLPVAAPTTTSIDGWPRATSADQGMARALAHLTEREAEVLGLVARGLSNQEIAARLVVAPDTVKTHIKHVYTKLGVRDRAQAVMVAYEGGLMTDRPRGW